MLCNFSFLLLPPPPPFSTSFPRMLFKDFVNNGFRISYTRYVLQAPVASGVTKDSPRINVAVRSPSKGFFSQFVWEPTYNTGTLGASAGSQESQAMGYQTWVDNYMTNITGNSNLRWPNLDPTKSGGDGWWCTGGCLLASTVAGAGFPAGWKTNDEYRRSLATYVQSLSNATLTPAAAQEAINDAIIVGFQINIGSFNPRVTSVVTDLRIQAGAYDWTWQFGG